VVEFFLVRPRDGLPWCGCRAAWAFPASGGI